mgnify:CR=1 FL=1
MHIFARFAGVVDLHRNPLQVLGERVKLDWYGPVRLAGEDDAPLLEVHIVVAEGHDRDAMKDPQVLRTMEKFQRYLERNPLGRHAGEAFVVISRLSVAEEWGISPDIIRPAGTGSAGLIGAAAVY